MYLKFLSIGHKAPPRREGVYVVIPNPKDAVLGRCVPPENFQVAFADCHTSNNCTGLPYARDDVHCSPPIPSSDTGDCWSGRFPSTASASNEQRDGGGDFVSNALQSLPFAPATSRDGAAYVRVLRVLRSHGDSLPVRTVVVHVDQVIIPVIVAHAAERLTFGEASFGHIAGQPGVPAGH